MCGRFSILDDLDKICERFNCYSQQRDFEPRYNVAPSQEVPVVICHRGRTILKNMRWGLIPHWAREGKTGNRLINARIETIREKPSFRSSFRHKRCIIPANGYYEWQKTGGGEKLPYRIMLESRELFAMAGLWDQWVDENGRAWFSFAIVTTDAAEAVQTIHNRMPFILQEEQEQLWLQGAPDADLLQMLEPARRLIAYRVSRLVNSPAHDVPACIEELG